MLEIFIILLAIIFGRQIAGPLYRHFNSFPMCSSPVEACLNAFFFTLFSLLSLPMAMGGSWPILGPLLNDEPVSPGTLFVVVMAIVWLTVELRSQGLKKRGVGRAPAEPNPPWLVAERRRMAAWRGEKQSEKERGRESDT